MAGLLDFLNTPQGMGLLSAAAGGLAGARRGTPWNNVGRGAVSGLMGYSNAQDQIRQDADNAFQQQYKNMQMEQMQSAMAKQKASDVYKAGLPAAIARTKPSVEQFQPDDPFNQGAAAFGEVYGGNQHGQQIDPAMGTMNPGDPNALNEYLLQDPNLEAKDALKFLNPNAIGSDAPSNVREWQYFKTLSEPEQLKYLEMKRSLGWQDQGGYSAPRLPGGRLGPAVPKTMPPAAAVSADQRQRELDYSTPKPKPAQRQIGVADPDGVTHYFPSQEAANAFKRAIGGR